MPLLRVFVAVLVTSAALLFVTSARAQSPERREPGVEKREGDRRDCALGAFCFGPVASVGVVNALGVGVHARYGERFGFGADWQTTPTVGGESLRLSTTSFTVFGRLYVGRGFFLATGIGRQSATVRTTESGISATTDAGVTGLHLGAGFTTGDNLVIGIDVGVLVPLHSPDVALVESSGVPAGVPYEQGRALAEARARDVVNALPIVPQVNLLRVGYLF